MITAPRLHVELPDLPRSDQQSVKGSLPDLVNELIQGFIYYETSVLTKIRSPRHHGGFMSSFCDPPVRFFPEMRNEGAEDRKESKTLDRYFTHSSAP